MSEELRSLTDQLRTKLATIQKDVDELGRDIRNATHHSETVTADFCRLEHSRKSIGSALMTAFDEMEKIDVLLLAAEHETLPGGRR